MTTFERNMRLAGLWDRYAVLPQHHDGMTVRCPTHNLDGTPCDPEDVAGCGSDDVIWDGEVYDCNECGIFFSDYAANPPHRRPKENA